MAVTEISHTTHGCGKTVLCMVPPGYDRDNDTNRLWELRKIDKCLAPSIEILNSWGCNTRACCCGHGITHGSIFIENFGDIRLKQCNKYK